MNRRKGQFLRNVVIGCLIALFVVAPAFASWQVSVFYGHSTRFGGEAEEGWHRGIVQIFTPRRDVIAGDG